MATLWIGSVGEARWLVRRANLPPPVRDLPVALGASVIVWAVLSTVENAVYDRYLYIPTGLLLAVRAIAIREPSAPPTLPRAS